MCIVIGFCHTQALHINMSQGVQTMKHNRFYSKNKFMKGDAKYRHNLSMCFTGYLVLIYSKKIVLAQTVHCDVKH